MKPERTKEEILNDIILVNTRLHSEDVILEMFTSIPPEGCKQIILAAMEEYRQSSPVESKWVSVTDRYPEYMDVVIIHATLGFVTQAQYGGGNTFCIGDESYSATHWQHLPLSPELPPIKEIRL